MQYLVLGTLVTAAVATPRTATSQAAFPWHPPDPPPVVAGLRLGGSRASIDSALGAPSSVQDLTQGSLFINYEGPRALTVGYTTADGIAIINLRSPSAGAIGGVRVGDSLATTVRRWGPPTMRDTHVAGYICGWWVVVLYLDQDDATVRMLGIGRVAG